MLFVRWQIAVMFLLMNLKMWMLTVWTLLSRWSASSRDRPLRISQNRIFEKDFLSNKAQVTVAPYKVVTSSQDLADIDLSKNYVLKTATGGYDGHGQKVIRSKQIWKRPMLLADSADCVLEEFVNFDLEISVIVSGNGKDVTVFPVQENIHRNNILSKLLCLLAFQKV